MGQQIISEAKQVDIVSAANSDVLVQDRRNKKTKRISVSQLINSGIAIESGTFTLSADGMSATGGTLTNPGANPTLTITTTKRLRLGFFNVFETGSDAFGSNGQSDGVINNCIATNNGSAFIVQSASDGDFCIYVVDSIVIGGWSGAISIQESSFSISFSQIMGAGLAITGQWHGIM